MSKYWLLQSLNEEDKPQSPSIINHPTNPSANPVHEQPTAKDLGPSLPTSPITVPTGPSVASLQAPGTFFDSSSSGPANSGTFLSGPPYMLNALEQSNNLLNSGYLASSKMSMEIQHPVEHAPSSSASMLPSTPMTHITRDGDTRSGFQSHSMEP